jgi:thiol:disulfide interchange protein DsbD
MHWGLLKREVFIGIWVLIGAATTTYLFGWLRLGDTMAAQALSKPRIMAGVLFAVFTIYLILGLTNTRWANLSLISGFPPPLTYSVYGHQSAPGKGVEPVITNDYEQALELSQKTGKPLLLDFTGWACVNCRKMEEQVWPRDGIKEVLEKEVILVSLYVDDRKALPDDRQFLYKMADGSSKEIRTIGDLYATMQAENFRNASQPLYVLLGPGEQLLNRPVGYTPDVAAYQEWLQCGLQALRK